MTAQRLRGLRRELRLSAAALAVRAQVSRWKLIEFELGNLDLHPEELGKVENALRAYSREKIEAFSKVAQAV